MCSRRESESCCGELAHPRFSWLFIRPQRGGQRLVGCQMLRGSFSAVRTATIARKDAFCMDFRNIQDLHSFAPLESQVEKPQQKNHPENAFTPLQSQICSVSHHCFRDFSPDFAEFQFPFKSVRFRRDFHRTLPELRQIANALQNFCRICFFLQNLREISEIF